MSRPTPEDLARLTELLRGIKTETDAEAWKQAVQSVADEFDLKATDVCMMIAESHNHDAGA